MYDDFIWSEYSEIHQKRRHDILLKYPEAKTLFGDCGCLKYLAFIMVLDQNHLLHDRYQGVAGTDTDLPTYLETRLFITSIGKLIWFFFQSLFYSLWILIVFLRKKSTWNR